MSKNQGPVAAINSDEQETVARLERGEARRKAFGAWMTRDGNEIVEGYPERFEVALKHDLWRAFRGGEEFGRASR